MFVTDGAVVATNSIDEVEVISMSSIEACDASEADSGACEESPRDFEDLFESDDPQLNKILKGSIEASSSDVEFVEISKIPPKVSHRLHKKTSMSSTEEELPHKPTKELSQKLEEFAANLPPAEIIGPAVFRKLKAGRKPMKASMKKQPTGMKKKRPMKAMKKRDDSFKAFLKREHSKVYHGERTKLEAAGIIIEEAKKRAREAAMRRKEEKFA